MMSDKSDELRAIYGRRFAGREAYRDRVWRVLVDRFFQRWVPVGATVLDLGCGYGEFINNVRCGSKYGMDLNPATARMLASDVHLLAQDCSAPWPLPNASLDVVFTSNFLEHLPDKRTVADTLAQARRCLKPGGRFIAMGPNVRYLPGAYWDFWDHCVPLSDRSLGEALRTQGFEIELCHPRFLAYTMASGPRYPMVLLRAYLSTPFIWPLFGRQFLIVAMPVGSPRGAADRDLLHCRAL